MDNTCLRDHVRGPLSTDEEVQSNNQRGGDGEITITIKRGKGRDTSPGVI
jgi:hypothetical protein